MAANVFVLILLASLLKISYETATEHGHMYGRNTRISDQAEGNNEIPNDDHCHPEVPDLVAVNRKAKLRLSFAGRFLADVSTYNNYPENFNISTFDPVKYPGWNPKGTGDFRLVDCKVTQVCLEDGHCNQEDRIVGQPIIGSNSTTTGKLVDLDTDDQTQSQLWGLVIGVAGFLKGNFTERSFNHMHDACEGSGCSTVSAMTRFSAVFMSTLRDLTWSKSLVKESDFIQQVLSLSCNPGFKLYVKLNLHNMIVVSKSSDFPYGRVVGTIYAVVNDIEHNLPYGPYKRMLWSREGGHVPFYADFNTKNVVLDFANSVKFDIKGNLVESSRERMYLVLNDGNKRLPCDYLEKTNNLGELKLGGNNWFHTTAGIIDLSVKHKEKETHEIMKKTALAVIQRQTPTSCVFVWKEREDGLFVGAVSNRVMRQESNDKWDMTFRTFKYGSPVRGVSIHAMPRSSDQIDDPNNPPISIDAGISHTDGISIIHFQANNPAVPTRRELLQLDGQIYSYDIIANKDTKNEFKVEDLMVSIHLYSDYKFEGCATWYDHVYPIFQQYANLYPSMKPIIDLASYEDVTRKRELLKYALGLPDDHPNHMPVTRDLSKPKQQMILSWLNNLDPSSKLPRLGTATYNLDELKRTLQVALRIELSTIPPYLSALFSIKDGDNTEVAALIGSVVVEEMKHMALVSNLLNAIGGAPILNHPSVVPSYPAPLPGGANPGLVVKLARCSLNHIRTVFQWIERPDCEMVDSAVAQYLRTQNPKKVSPKDLRGKLTQMCQSTTTRPQTIGAIYIHQILCPMATLEEKYKESGSSIFIGDEKKHAQITSDHWFGDSKSSPKEVTDLSSAVSAILDITHEGEGSNPCNPFTERGELSHFFRFAEVVHGRKLVDIGSVKFPSEQRLDNFSPCDGDPDCDDTFGFVGRVVPFYEDGVWPTISNPHTDSYPPESQVRKYSDNFNTIYTGLLKCIHEAFNGNPNKMKDCMGMMSSLKAWGKKLVKTPIDPNGNPEIGPNAAPTFQFHDTSD